MRIRTAILPQLYFVATSLQILREHDLLHVGSCANQREYTRSPAELQYTSRLRAERMLVVEVVVTAKIERLVLLVTDDSVGSREP